MLYRIALSLFRSLRPALAEELFRRVGSEREFFELPESTLSAVMGFRNRIFSTEARNAALASARKELDFVERNSIRTIYFRDADYPQRLLQCEDAPLLLYTLGDCDLTGSKVISIVGTRHATAYGSDFVGDFVAGLAARLPDKPVIVSGLAYGIDIAAHRAAIKAGLPTVGVLAHGLNTLYPASHRSTAAAMVRGGGMLLTDYPSSTAIHKGNFLARNRIVAGLCDALVVVESAVKGGALVTARIASGYSRDVFALPGRRGDRYSEGCNRLIASQVAGLITSADDFICQMGWPMVETQPQLPLGPESLSPEERSVCELLRQGGDLSFSQLSARLDIPTPRLMSILVDMEFRTLLIQLPGGLYRLKLKM